MSLRIPEIDYKEKEQKLFFDLIDLHHIMSLKAVDHNQFEYHKIRFYVIFIATAGEGIHFVDYKEYTYRRGSVFTLRKNNVHKFYHSKAKGKLLVFTEEFIARYANQTQMLQMFQLFNEILNSPKMDLIEDDFVEIEKVIHQIEDEYSNINDENSAEIIRSLLQVLVLKLLRFKSKISGSQLLEKSSFQLKVFQDLVEENCLQHRGVSFYASEMSMTPKRLNHLTQILLQRSAKSFVDEIATLHIKRLLMNAVEVNLKEISYAAGFNTPTNFSKYFRKNTGKSPKEFKSSVM